MSMAAEYFKHELSKEDKSDLRTAQNRLLEDLGSTMPIQSLERSKTLNLKVEQSSALNFLDGVYSGAIEEPAAALRQVFSPASSKANEKVDQKAMSHRVGEIVGSGLPFLGLALLTRSSSSALIGGKTELSMGRILAEQSIAGAALGGLLTKSELKPGESLLEARLKQGSIMAATFASMAGSAHYMNRRLLLSTGNPGLADWSSSRILTGAGSGFAGGVVEAELSHGFRPSGEELLSSALGYASLGAVFEGGTGLLRSFAQLKRSKPQALAGDPEKQPYLKLLSADPHQKPQPEIRAATLQESADSFLIKGAAAFEQEQSLAAKVQAEAKRFGQEPGQAIAAALRKDRMVMVGEFHVIDNPHRLMGALNMPLFRKSGLSHLAIEHSSDFKGKIYRADGSVKTETLPPLLAEPEFFRLLEAAKKEGIKVVPVDVPLRAARDLKSRNQHMEKELSAILAEDPKNKVLYWVGNTHLSMIEGTDGPQVARLLREKGVTLSTFFGLHDNHWREVPARGFYTPERAVAVPTAEATATGSLKWKHADEAGHDLLKLADFDYVINYPRQRPSHWD